MLTKLQSNPLSLYRIGGNVFPPVRIVQYLLGPYRCPVPSHACNTQRKVRCEYRSASCIRRTVETRLRVQYSGRCCCITVETADRWRQSGFDWVCDKSNMCRRLTYEHVAIDVLYRNRALSDAGLPAKPAKLLRYHEAPCHMTSLSMCSDRLSAQPRRVMGLRKEKKKAARWAAPWKPGGKLFPERVLLLLLRLFWPRLSSKQLDIRYLSVGSWAHLEVGGKSPRRRDVTPSRQGSRSCRR